MKRLLVYWFLLLLTVLMVFQPALVFAQSTPSVNNNDVSIEALERELANLKAQLATMTAFETPLDEREAYAKRIIELMAKMAALEEENEDKKEGAPALILKRVKLSYRIKGSGLADFQYDENYNTDGFASEGREDHWIRTLKVEEYPTKIVVGEPFTFKAMAVRRLGTSRIYIQFDRLFYGTRPDGEVTLQVAGNQSSSAGQPPSPITVNTGFSLKNESDGQDRSTGLYEADQINTNGRFELTNNYDNYPNAKTLVLEAEGPASNKALVVRFLIPIDPSVGSSNRGSRRINEEEKQLEFIYQYGHVDDTPVSITDFRLPDDADQPQETALFMKP